MSLRWRIELVGDVVLTTATTLLSLYIITRFYDHPLVFSTLTRVLRGVWIEGERCCEGKRWRAPPLSARAFSFLVPYVLLAGGSIVLSLYVMAHMPIAAIMVVDALYPGVLLALGGLLACCRRLRPSYARGAMMAELPSDSDQSNEVFGVDERVLAALLPPPPSRAGLHVLQALAVAVVVAGSVLTVVGPGGASPFWAGLEFGTLVLSALAAYVHTAWLREPDWRPAHVVRMVVWPEVLMMSLLALVIDRPRSWRALGLGAAWAAAYTLVDVPRYWIDLRVRAGGGSVVDPIVMSMIGNVVSLAVICLNMWITRTPPTRTVVLGVGVSIVGIILFQYAASRLSKSARNGSASPTPTDDDLASASA